MENKTESDFRSRVQKFSFSMNAWDLLAWAAVFAAIDPIAKGVAFVASEGLAAVTTSALVAGAVPVLLFGAITLGSIYMGRREERGRKEVEDRLDELKSEIKAEGLQHTHKVEVPARSHNVEEYPDNKRKDGKTWVETSTGIDAASRGSHSASL